MTSTARHYAEKVRSLVARLDEHHANAVATLFQPEVSAETCRALQDARMTLEAELKHAAAQLASVVLAETAPTVAPMPNTYTTCLVAFAGHVCHRVKGHNGCHEDMLTAQRWD